MSGDGPSEQTETTNSSTNNSTNMLASSQQSTVPDWLNQSSYDTAAYGAQLLGQYNPRNSQVNQAASNASAFGNLVNPSYDAASAIFNQDRGGGYAQSAIEALMGMAGGNGAGGMSGMSRGNVPNVSGAVRDASWKNFTDYDVGAYSSPYTQQVVDATMSDMDRANQIETLRRGSDAQRAGAYGGSRHGVADAVGQGEYARALAAATGQLRDTAFTRATDLIGRDQQGDLAAQQSNQQGDAAELNASTSMYNSDNAAGASMWNASQGNRLAALQAALSGGLGLGGLDLERGGALQGLGESAQDRLSSMGINLAQLDQMPFGMTMQYGNMLGGLPTDRGQNTTSIGSQSGTSTGTGTGNTSSQQDNTAMWAGLMLQLI